MTASASGCSAASENVNCKDPIHPNHANVGRIRLPPLIVKTVRAVIASSATGEMAFMAD